MIIDTHTHIYPHKISNAAVRSISDFYDVEMSLDGTLETLIQKGTEAGVDKFVVHSVATTANQVESINNFIISSVNEYPDRLIGFMTMHPDYKDFEKEMARAVENGLKGIKLHPDFQKFSIDDPKMFPLYEAASGKMPILFHTGDPRYQYSNPYRVAKILDNFPKLQVIGAHFAGWSEWDNAIKDLKGYRLWVDTSSSSHWLSDEKLKELINFYGDDYVMFASDYPMWSAKDELERLYKLKLPESLMEKILYKNATQLLGL